MTSNTQPNYLGGYESDVYIDCKDDAFADVLNTDIATTVLLCNHDLSEKKPIRCVIQGNTADTHLKSMERVGLFQRNTVKAGMYIYFENRYWLITGYPGTNGIYEKATLQLCLTQIRWQDSRGKILERWITATSAAKYDVGEKGNATIILSSDNLTIMLPSDDDALDLDGKRVFIDKRNRPIKVYKLTRSDDVLYDYGDEYHGSVLAFIANKTELNTDVDNQKLRICDYVHPREYARCHESNETKVLCVNIVGNDNLKCGYSRSYGVFFENENNNKIDDYDFNWNIVSDFKVEQKISDDSIELFVDNEDYIGSSFLLQVLDLNNAVLTEKEITVINAF